MSLSIGIVGLPNVGKSTIFNSLTRQKVDAANYPFCTIEPNVGCVKVPDDRLDKLAKMSKSEKDDGRGDYDPSHEAKLKGFISKIVNDMCVYGKVDNIAATQASSLIKFNKKLSEEYAKKLSNPKYSEKLEHALYLLLKDTKDVSIIKTNEFLDYVQKLMSIKVTKQQVYFKKIITEIHYEVILSLKLEKWFDGLSIQSKSISRNFIAYYLAFYLRGYV